MKASPLPHRSWLEIRLASLHHNAVALRKCAPKGASLLAAVKADAYGHGMDLVVPALKGIADWLGVANLEEARRVRTLGATQPVLIFGATLPFEHEHVIRGGFLPVISTLEEALSYSGLAQGGAVQVHLAVDTGMGRVGVWEREAIPLAQAINALPGIQLAGVGSHFPVADEDEGYTQAQATRFQSLVQELRARGLVQGMSHIANSAGLLGFPDSASEMFRVGLALYGCPPRPEWGADLEPVATWKTRVTLVREVEAGRSISYGRSFVAAQRLRVATLCSGYADGVRRHLSNRGASVLVDGKRCPILGRVTMDQIMVDVSECDRVGVGDEVVLIGSQCRERIAAEELAALAGTIPYDIFTGIGARVARVAV